MNITAAARKVNVHKATVHRWIRNGNLRKDPKGGVDVLELNALAQCRKLQKGRGRQLKAYDYRKTTHSVGRPMINAKAAIAALLYNLAETNAVHEAVRELEEYIQTCINVYAPKLRQS